MNKWKRKLTMTQTLLMSTLLLMTLLTGCRSTNIYVMDGHDIINVAQDEEFTAPRNGYFLSDEYFKKVLKAKTKEF